MNSCLPRVVSVFQDARVVILEYADAFRCDLSLAIQNVQISIEAKVYFIACIYSAIATLHENAVMHRFINSSSIYLTELGVPKVIDELFQE
jgi:serine/threonine protein kinase